ncbi:MAG: ChaN family lipoprotein [Desulfonatronovibrionaceae bacterium]
MLEEKDYILVAESHDNPCDHQVQARLVELAAENSPGPVIGLEMVSVKHQNVLYRFNNGQIPVNELAQELDWEENWGFDFELYRPVFQAAARLDLPLEALNVPGRITRTINRQGQDELAREDLKYLPVQVIDPPEEQLEFLKEQYASHEDFFQGHGSSLDNFIAAQSVWDSKMAEQAWRIHSRTGRPVVILAGSGHVASGHGIEHRLRVLDPEARMARFIPVRSLDAVVPDGSFYYFCPKTGKRTRLGIVASETESGVKITGVLDNSLAMKAGLQKQDLIVLANDKPVKTMVDLHNAVGEAVQESRRILFEVIRDQEPVSIEIKFD